MLRTGKRLRTVGVRARRSEGILDAYGGLRGDGSLCRSPLKNERERASEVAVRFLLRRAGSPSGKRAH